MMTDPYPGAWNRLIKVSQGSTVLGEYQYDGLSRRTWKKTTENSFSVTRHFYYSSQWQVLEERLGSAMQVAERQFVWGLRYIDDLVLRDRLALASSSSSWLPTSSSSSGSGAQRLYATHDQWHVTAVLGTGGTVQERYAYEAFGTSIVLSASFSSRTVSLFDWETRYGAYRFDPEANLYYVRYRYLHPKLGRWLSRDPADELNRTDLYSYCSDAPTNRIDREGLEDSCCGPDVTQFFVNLINSAIQWRASLGAVSRKKGIDWLWNHGSNLDWWSIPKQPYYVNGCATGHCASTYWLCGECVHDHWIGNFMFGFIGRLFLIPDWNLGLGGRVVQHGRNFWRYAEPPWDTAEYDIARNIYESLLLGPVFDICTALKYDPALWRQANDTSAPAEGGVKPHASGKDCEPCASSLPLSSVITVPGGKFGTTWPPP